MKLKKLLSRVIIATGILLTGTITYQTAEQTHVSEELHIKIIIIKVNALGGLIKDAYN